MFVRGQMHLQKKSASKHVSTVVVLITPHVAHFFLFQGDLLLLYVCIATSFLIHHVRVASSESKYIIELLNLKIRKVCALCCS